MTYAVDRNYWEKKDIFEQMGNISSEVGRAFKAKRQGDDDDSRQALIRALDLFDATAEVQLKIHPVRVKEILRAREQFLTMFYDKQADSTEVKKLENYFLQFAIAARLAAL